MDFLCSLPVIAGLFSHCVPPLPLATGYVEGEYVLVAPVETGRIVRLLKKRGDRVAKGELLVQMEDDDAVIAVRQAEGALDQAKAQLANLKEGKRPEELAVIEASLQSAEAQQAEARRVFNRESTLAKRGINATAVLDQATSALQQADALVNQTSANLAVARLPARPMEIEAAEAQVKQAEQQLADAHWRLDHRRLTLPSNGVVDDIIRREGEVAGPSQPVISVLPDGAVKIRLYAGEQYMSGLKLGSELAIHCDGCNSDLRARISYVSDSPEFTPPVIYSLENRQKLVFLIEARPEHNEPQLKPGQIVDAVLSGRGKMNAIEVHDLVKKYGDKTVVDHVSMTVPTGEIVGFLGPNGSGKTTTIRMMCGLLTPDKGSGTVLGLDLARESLKIKRQVGYMTQKFSFYEDLSIEENLMFVARLYGLRPLHQRVAQTLEDLGLTSRKDQLAGKLSGGWKQRLALAACIMHAPKLLLLDEPTAGVDPKARREFWDEIHRLAAHGMTVLVSTHYMDEAERCHRIHYISYGKLLASGTVAEVVKNAGLHTYVLAGEGIGDLVDELRKTPGIDQVAPFGAALHVVGKDKGALEAALAPYRSRAGVTVFEGQTSLEDVFIQFMAGSKDNMG